MTRQLSSGLRQTMVVTAAILVAAATGYGVGRFKPSPPRAAPTLPNRPLYWYDPMVPAQHFDKPGKSPYMDMQMVPRYADASPAAASVGVSIDPATQQNLGMRLASVVRGSLTQSLDVTGVVDFNQRDVEVIQTRAAGFVQRVYGRAPGDVLAAGAPIADIMIPSWSGAQAEYLAVRKNGDPVLEAAARQRLRLLGVPDPLVDAAVRDDRPHTVVTARTATAGALQSLDVRQGMTVSMGQTLAQVSGLSRVWLNASVPEALAAQAHVGQQARAELPAFAGETFSGQVTAILPSAQTDSRTLTVRIELANRGGKLRPGMFATVHLWTQAKTALLVPSEAVIRTGKRSIVMLASDAGHFQAVEVRIGADVGGRTEILAGLDEGQKVVASGQFLIDSEASLSGLQARPSEAPGVAP